MTTPIQYIKFKVTLYNVGTESSPLRSSIHMLLKGTNRQPSGQMIRNIKNKTKSIEIQSVRPGMWLSIK